MSKGVTLEDFIDAVEDKLKRAEAVINRPSQFENELGALDEFLRNHWPNAIHAVKDSGIGSSEKEKMGMILKKIRKLELNTKTSISLFDGIEDFMLQPRNREY